MVTNHSLLRILCIIGVTMFKCKSVFSQNNFQWERIYSTSITVSWTVVQGVTYSVIAGKSEEVYHCNNGIITLRSPFTVTHNGNGFRLTPNTSYNILLCTRTTTNEKLVLASRLDGIKTGPPPPNNLNIVSSTTNQIDITWDDPCATDCDEGRTADYYRIYRQESDSTSTTRFGIRNKNQRSTSIPGLISNTRYIITMDIRSDTISTTGTNRFVFSDISLPISGITVPSIPVFSGPCDVESSTTQVCVSWNISGGNAIENYTLRWVTSGDSSVAQSINVDHNPNVLSRTYTIENLLPGQTIFVNLNASNSAGTNGSSQNFYTTNPSIPRNVQFSTTPSEISVQWDKPVGYFTYVVIKSPSSAFKESNFGESETSFTITNLTSGTMYEITMYSILTVGSNSLESERVIRIVTAQTEDQENSVATGNNTAIFIGVGAGVAVILLVILIVIFINRRRKNSKENISNRRTNENASANLPRDVQSVLAPMPVSAPPTNLVPVPTETENSKSNSRRVYLPTFVEYFNSLHENNNKILKEEFQELSAIGRDFETTAASKPNNKKKNRYKNIHPYDNNRVILSTINEAESDYINASYVKGLNREKEYIATQGPRDTTVDDFVRMIWEQNCTKIVMLTELLENGKTKCEKYWPDDENPVDFGEIKVQMLCENRKRNWIIRDLCFTKNDVPRFVHHYHYTAWPDHGVPDTSKGLVRFVSYVRLNLNKEGNTGNPIIVHCSAGVGRTGTFIAVDQLLQHLKEHQYVDIFGLVHEMRTQRSFMVQTKRQYYFLYKMVQELINHEYDVIDDDGETLYASSGIYQNVPPSTSVYENTCIN